MLRVILVTIVMILILSAPVFAEETGIHGDVSFKYELADYYPAESWKVNLYYSFNTWISIGVTENTYTNGYAYPFNYVPDFIPCGQLWECYTLINIGDSVTLKLSQWCYHPVYSGQGLTNDELPFGIYIEGSYKF